MRSLRPALGILVLFSACAVPGPPVPADEPSRDFEALLLRDFLEEHKTDEAGHPLNALVLEGEQLCEGPGVHSATSFRSTNVADTICVGTLPRVSAGRWTLNVRVRAFDINRTSKRDVVRISVGGSAPRSVSYTGRSFRASGQWTFIPLELALTAGASPELRIETFGRGAVEIDYVELVPARFSIALGPGSGVLGDEDEVTLEVAREQVPVLTVDGDEVPLEDLVADGQAFRTDTTYRRLYSIPVGLLAAGHTGSLDLRARANGDAARMRVDRAAAPCLYEGDPNGTRVLVTGFHPFPADGTHDNVSDVALRSLDPARLVGARVMRMTLPVEYDRAPDLVVDAIERCAPEVVIDFGQGGFGIDLERTAYNLKDTGIAPDNRGRFQAGTPILDEGPETLPSGLPLTAIAGRLKNLPEVLSYIGVSESEDPGRYVCNDTFYRVVSVAAARGVRAGFVHLPYTTQFDPEVSAAWGEVARAVIEASVAP